MTYVTPETNAKALDRSFGIGTGGGPSESCMRALGRVATRNGIFFPNPDPPSHARTSPLLSLSAYFAHSSQECLKFSQLKAMAVAVASLARPI